MTRRFIAAVVLTAALAGCGKKVELPGVGSVGGDGAVTEKPEVTYTLKVREKQAGDRFEVTEQFTTTTKDQVGEKKPVEGSSGAKYEYAETVEEAKDGRLTRVKRAYKVAELSKDGKPYPASFAGKTVKIVLVPGKGGQYSFRFEKGGDVPAAERKLIDFGGKDYLAGLLPSRAVKVGETFNLASGQLALMFDPVTQGKVSPTGDGKLTKAYPKDGRQYGAFEIGVNLNLPTGPESRYQPGSSDNTVVTYDGCIDGSATDGEVKATHLRVLAERDGRTGVVRKQTTETVRTMTVRPAAKP